MLTHDLTTPELPARTVVLGAAGFVGGVIARRLEARGGKVLRLTRAEVDLMDAGAAEDLAGHLRSDDAFVAVAAKAPVKNAAMLRENLVMIEAIANALGQQPVAHVVNIGSDAVYSDSEAPLTEASCRAAGSLHGIMHLAREVMLGDAVGETPIASLRSTLIYGAGDPHNGYGPNRFLRQARAGETIRLFGEGEERRDHVWVEDVAELAVRMVMHRSRGALNAATGTVISFRDLAEHIASRHGARVEGSPRQGPMPHGGFRPFDPAATLEAFPDFTYTQPLDGIDRVDAG